MNHDERALHIAIADYLDRALPRGAVWFHPANGEKREPKTAALLKRLGVKPGIPDIIVMYDGRALAIEVKAPGAKLSPAQEAMRARLVEAAIPFCVAYKMEAVEHFLTGHRVPLRARVERRAA